MKVKAIFGIIDNEAKEVANISSNATHNASSVYALNQNNAYVPKIATFENQYWLLDGSFNFFVNSDQNRKNNGWWSNSQSNGDGEFTTPPVLIINFPFPITTIGLTFIFGHENIVKDLQVEWKLNGVIVDTYTETNNSNSVCIIENHVESYDSLVITFNKTIKPYRFVKLARLDFGIGKEFTSQDLVSINCEFNTDLTSKEANVSTMYLNLHSEEAEFSILNPSGVYLALKERQKIDIYIDNLIYSRFYLKNWYSIDDYNYSFECDNTIGVMNDITFEGGMYNNYSAKTLINTICAKAGFGVEYKDDNIDSKVVSGWIDKTSCREALKQVLFATGNIILPRSIDDVIKIGVAGSNILVDEITNEDMYFGNKMLLKNMVTHINIQTHKYTLSSTPEEVFKGDLKAGRNIIEFNMPYGDISLSVDTGSYNIINQSCNHIEFDITNDTQVIINGKLYEDNAVLVRKQIANGYKENVIEIKDATLINSINVDNVLDVLEWYFTKRIERTINYDYEMKGDVGDKIWVSNVFNTQNNCVVENLSIDLITNIAKSRVIVNE
jgi:hypothetical protein